MNKDLYKILGVDSSADDKKLKSAYRKLAKKYHPDANPGDKDAEQKFKDIGEAYTILSDPEKRKLYDQFGYAAFDGSGAGAATSPSNSAARTRRTCSAACSAIFSAEGRSVPDSAEAGSAEARDSEVSDSTDSMTAGSPLAAGQEAARPDSSRWI